MVQYSRGRDRTSTSHTSSTDARLTRRTRSRNHHSIRHSTIAADIVALHRSTHHTSVQPDTEHLPSSERDPTKTSTLLRSALYW